MQRYNIYEEYESIICSSINEDTLDMVCWVIPSTLDSVLDSVFRWHILSLRTLLYICVMLLAAAKLISFLSPIKYNKRIKNKKSEL